MTSETTLRFGAHRTLVGILTVPERGRADTALIVLNAGLIHHIGPHRLHVTIARALAQNGVGCLRFDFSGVGDSPARPDNLPIFEMVVREPIEAMDELERRGFKRFVLAGICSGAYSAFKVAAQDERVMGAVLINLQDFAPGQGVEMQAWERRYLTRSIFRPQAWLNLVSGRVDYGRLLRTAWARLSGRTGRANVELASVRQELQQLIERGRARLLFVVSEDDVSREYLALMLGHQASGAHQGDRVRTVMIPRADHLFTRLAHQQILTEHVVSWTKALASLANPEATSTMAVTDSAGAPSPTKGCAA